MSEKRFSLDVIGVAEPCHEDWSGMSGGEQKKFCDSCAKHVHNLSEMTRDEAEEFVTANPTGVCIRFHRDAQTGKMVTAEDRCAPEPVSKPTPTPGPGRGRFSGPVPRHTNTTRRRAYRLAGNAYVPFLAVFSVLAGVVAVLLNGGRAPTNTGSTCTMGDMAQPPTHQPQPGQPLMGAVAVPPDIAIDPGLPGGPHPTTMGGIRLPEHMRNNPDPAVDPAPPVVEPAPPIMGIIGPPQPQIPVPPQPAPPEIMGEIEMIMGDIVCPDEPAEVVEPIAPRREGNAAQN